MMIRYLQLLCLLLPLLSSFAMAETDSTDTVAEKTVLRFAPLPMENRKAVYKQFEPLRIYLQQITKKKVVFKFFDQYDQLLDAFIDDDIDLAYLGPLPYVELKNRYTETEPLVTFRESNGKAGYTCSLISLPENQILLSRIEDKKIALTQRLSTCGYLSVNWLLAENGSDLEKNQYDYLGRHDAVALAVVRAEFDIGGVKTTIAHKYEHLGLTILAETDVLPGFALVANKKTITPEVSDAIRTFLPELQPEGKDREMMSAWGSKIANGAIAVTDTQYDVIRKLMPSHTISEQDNF